MDILFASAPGFDQPLAVLKHCHDRIRKQLATLERLPSHLEKNGADIEAQKAAVGILRYFQSAAPLHHDDEEIDLLPVLQKTAQAEDAQILESVLPKILHQHEIMALQWQDLAQQLSAIAEGNTGSLEREKISAFNSLYQDHMQIEESQIAPMAMRILNAQQMHTLGLAMQHRRGIVAP
ncbi:hemerythrin domain-containing protein [Undibacterium fentianense]|uniref:Hemerythrin domain-containing protein n=1 Tax=Undibacterium fentianense TaxID=2828728 RepID=A0A941E4V1_9BURK|nr:hemerythrin domain-containing protein [Undibacterium fentianense]MBR7800981.1 hemerythrin domain-containing protein [Undibacterium fentianense]